MNVHGVVSGVISVVNPWVLGCVLMASGSDTAADGTVTEGLQVFQNQRMQVQAISTGDLQHVDGLNLQRNMMAVYLNGNIDGVNRKAGKGGDLLLFQGGTWLVTNTVEPWTTAGWTKVVVVEQVVSATVGPITISPSAWAAFVASLPTVPAVPPVCWNNAGVPTYP